MGYGGYDGDAISDQEWGAADMDSLDRDLNEDKCEVEEWE